MHALLALFIRSVRDDLRSKSLMWARIALAVMVVFKIFTVRISSFYFGSPGLQFFNSVVYYNAVFIGMAGLSYFASAITEEKEEGTLGLLRMTDLNPLSILLGKSTSRFLGGMLLLLVQFPFALLAVTLGGLTWGQVASCYLVLGAFLFLACNFGLLGSVLSQRTGAAALIAGLLGFFFVFGGPFFDSLFGSGVSSTRDAFFALWSETSVLQAIDGLLSTNGGLTATWQHTVAWMLGGGTVAFLLSWALFDRFCRDLEVLTKRGKQSVRGVFKTSRSRPWLHAIAWKDFYFIHGGKRVVWVKVLLYLCVLAWVFYWVYQQLLRFGLASSSGYSSSPYQRQWFFAQLLSFSLFILFLEAAFATSRVFKFERREKTLSTLGALPQDTSELIRQKRRAIVVSLLPSFAFCAVGFFGCIDTIFSGLGESMKSEAFFYVVMVIVGVIGSLFLAFRFIAWLSLILKWGALPLSLIILWISMMITGVFLGLIFREGTIVIAPISVWIVAYVFKRQLHKRLEVVMSEE